jgi:hypothetical protein
MERRFALPDRFVGLVIDSSPFILSSIEEERKKMEHASATCSVSRFMCLRSSTDNTDTAVLRRPGQRGALSIS